METKKRNALKQYILGIILFIIFSNIYAQSDMNTDPEILWQWWSDGGLIRYVYGWGDEFNGTALDESKWQNSYPWGRNFSGTCSQEYMTNGDNILVEDGLLKLIAKKEDIYARGVPYEDDDYLLTDGLPNLRWWHYTSGMIFSKREFKNGLFHIRCKLPTGKGFFPAFWLYSGGPHEEIDIFEYKGETPSKIHINVHCPDYQCEKFGGWCTSLDDFSTQFTVFEGQWDSEAVLFPFANATSIVIATLNKKKPIIANFSIANDSPCAFGPGPDDSTPFPATFEIDYIRVWKRYYCESTIVISNYSQTRSDPTIITGQNIEITNMPLSSEQSLSLIASDQITIGPDTYISGNFDARMVDCPEFEYASPFYSEIEIASDSLLTKESFIDEQYNNQAVENKKAPVLNAVIFPNPSHGKISFEFETKTEMSQHAIKIELINAMGQIVFIKENINDNHLDIDITHLPKGIFFLRGTFGKEHIIEKIILQ